MSVLDGSVEKRSSNLTELNSGLDRLLEPSGGSTTLGLERICSRPNNIPWQNLRNLGNDLVHAVQLGRVRHARDDQAAERGNEARRSGASKQTHPVPGVGSASGNPEERKLRKARGTEFWRSNLGRKNTLYCVKQRKRNERLVRNKFLRSKWTMTDMTSEMVRTRGRFGISAQVLSDFKFERHEDGMFNLFTPHD
ncbi:hypothetical protein B0H17DRAFT_1130228 [Mycena rosella]|uniref:Uncharacterized protein n=1 Tax=Mycena rosella TaxID=1033263 RepID=A0AAD7DTA9_MYCRO|nr:hypothetical protein B0H17DRAFT_1130228 [Mycena rosella]